MQQHTKQLVLNAEQMLTIASGILALNGAEYIISAKYLFGGWMGGWMDDE